MFKKKPQRKLIIVPKKTGRRKISWRRIGKEVKIGAKRFLKILATLAFLGLWLLSIYTVYRIERPIEMIDIIDIVWAAVMTLIVAAGIWAQIGLRRRPPKDWR